DEKEYIYDYKYFCELKNNMGGGYAIKIMP
ncbi:WxcM-like domain-containing protein, partial [Campylobacter jejuni]|nr:WxcM-like domain-containing protein [Campylobacter jejuni]